MGLKTDSNSKDIPAKLRGGDYNMLSTRYHHNAVFDIEDDHHQDLRKVNNQRSSKLLALSAREGDMHQQVESFDNNQLP